MTGGGFSRRQVLQLLGGAGAAAVLGPVLAGCDGGERSFAQAGPTTNLGRGGWCWFQAPRAALAPDDRLWLGTTVDGTGSSRDGQVEVTAFDTRTRRVVERHTLGDRRADDHTSPSVYLIGSRPQVAWAPHAREDWIDVGMVGSRLQRIHRPASLSGVGRGMSYASAHQVAGARWILYRGEEFSWNLLRSTDAGRSWTAHGLVIAPNASGQRPYMCAASDGQRLHLMATNGNPTEYRGNNVGYCSIDGNLTIRDNAGKTIGRVGSSPAPVGALTRLFTGKPGATEQTDTDGWVCDVKIVDHHPTAILSVRDNWPSGGSNVGNWRHRYLWARQRNGGRWTVEHLAWAGSELYKNQPDYTGLGVIDPSNPSRTVISTDVHPATGTPLRSSADGKVHHELWEGLRTGEGKWAWTALTANSRLDNLRPVITSNGHRKSLAWLQGTYTAWFDWSTDVLVRST